MEMGKEVQDKTPTCLRRGYHEFHDHPLPIARVMSGGKVIITS